MLQINATNANSFHMNQNLRKLKINLIITSNNNNSAMKRLR